MATISAPTVAQIIFDGNIVWSNVLGANTESDQYVGSAPAGATSCSAGFTTEDLATTTYTNNTFTDPQLIDPLNIVNPDFRPTASSPAWAGNAPHGVVMDPVSSFFEPTCYVGAMSPTEPAWTDGWTYFDSLGAGRDDLHLPGMTDPRPLAGILANINQFQSRTLVKDSLYVIRGTYRVKAQSTLTIQAGTVILEESATSGFILVERGGRIEAVGTKDEPIIITTDLPPGQQVPGNTGGIVINGFARTNNSNSCAGDSSASEGGNAGFYGGNDDADDSGTLKYVRVEYAGVTVGVDNELNSFTFNAVGTGTDIDYIQSHRGKDDGFEFFGGAAQVKHAVASDGFDDGFDWQMGFRGKAQFVLCRVLADQLPGVDPVTPDRGIEADNNENDNDETQCSGRSNPQLSNVTLVGDHRNGVFLGGVDVGIRLRRGTNGSILNSIIYNFKNGGLRITDLDTWESACAAGFPATSVLCNGSSVDVSLLKQGSVFLTRSFPNPFRASVAIRFALPEPSHVRIELYGVDGRHVSTLVDDDLPAGNNQVTWNASRETPNGMYFYKVIASGEDLNIGAGKLLKVN